MTPELTPERYTIERAIVDKAAAYWQANATHGRSGSSMSAELAAHPDYAVCTNDMRGRVEQFELLRDLPDSFCAYASGGSVTVWTGDRLGSLVWTSSRPQRGAMSDRYYYGSAIVGGVHYAAQGAGEGMLVRLRRLKNQPKAA